MHLDLVDSTHHFRYRQPAATVVMVLRQCQSQNHSLASLQNEYLELCCWCASIPLSSVLVRWIVTYPQLLFISNTTTASVQRSASMLNFLFENFKNSYFSATKARAGFRSFQIIPRDRSSTNLGAPIIREVLFWLWTFSCVSADRYYSPSNVLQGHL